MIRQPVLSNARASFAVPVRRRGRRRVSRAALPAAFAAALVLPYPAAAGAPDSASIVPLRERQDNQRAQQVMYAFAVCIVRRWRSDAEAFLTLFPGSQAAMQALNRMAASMCLNYAYTELRFTVQLFRGAVYDRLYKIEFEKGAAPDIGKAPPIDYSVNSRTVAPVDAARQINHWRFADCVVRANPAAARALILSEYAGKGESEGFDALRPDLVRCMPAGADYRFTRPMLRGLIAESLFRLSASVAGRPVAAGGR